MKKIIVMLAVTAMLALSMPGQGFFNLNFEAAYNLPANPPFPSGELVPAANALPDWIAYGGDTVLSSINYASNDISGVRTLVELEGGSLALSGSFSVGLFLD